ncbi:putative HNH endonuclease L245 [Chlorella vulgaris]
MAAVETWKAHPVLAQYEANDLGSVRRVKTGRVLRPTICLGYAAFSLCIDGKRVRKSRARFVLETFASLPAPGMTADHIDNTAQTDDRLVNLRWASMVEQANNRRPLDRVAKSRPVIRISLDGGKATFRSQREAARQTIGAQQRGIGLAIGAGQVYKGYTWHFPEQPDLPGEQWTPALQRNGMPYACDPMVDVSQYGRTRDRRNQCVVKRSGHELLTPLKRAVDGYPELKIFGKARALHEVVATTLIGPRPAPSMVINHKNHDKADARVDNLEWVTQSANVTAAHDAGRYAGRQGGRKRVQIDANDHVYESMTAAARQHNVSKETIRRWVDTGRATLV